MRSLFMHGFEFNLLDIEAMFQSTILITLSLAIFDLVKTIFEEEAELEFKVREYLLSLNLTEKELKSIQDKVGIWFDIESDIKYNRNMFSKTCTKIRKLREKGYTIQNITEWEIKKN
mgnify:CR=1 FL=1